MNPTQLIQKLLSSKSYTEIFTDLNNYKSTFKEFAKLVHPDVCKEKDAAAAFDKLRQYEDFIQYGKKFQDDAGEAVYFPDRIEFTGKKELLELSYNNYKKLIVLKTDWAEKMRVYLPKSGEFIGDKLVFTLWERGLPLLELGTQSHDHVNWITNRMFYFVDWLCSAGYTHNGINPTSLVVLPENHGIVCISFYHMKPLRAKIETISATYASFYPNKLFTDKKSLPTTDIELVKKTAIWLLGDKSGVGVKLRKTHKAEIIDFLTRWDDNPYTAIDYHKELIKKLFEKRFVTLEV